MTGRFPRCLVTSRDRQCNVPGLVMRAHRHRTAAVHSLDARQRRSPNHVPRTAHYVVRTSYSVPLLTATLRVSVLCSLCLLFGLHPVWLPAGSIALVPSVNLGELKT